jgi:DNA-binding transcriptional MerR regulator
VPELMAIGEVARRAGVATSTVRYYERRGLLTADARQSGQRRFRAGTLRRLVFIGMLQDIGLSLGEIHGVLDAATAAEWKSIAGQRLAALDEQIAQLRHARELLAATLGCRYDHPATDCRIMGAEIDRLLDAAAQPCATGRPKFWPSGYPASVPECASGGVLSPKARDGADE